MPMHKPIRFKDPTFSEEAKKYVEKFMKKHPVSTAVLKAVLATAIVGGVLTTAFVAPGLFAVAGKRVAAKRRDKSERYRRMWARFNDLRKRKDIEYVGESKDGELIYKFSDKGRIIAKKFLLETLSIERPKKWDGKWRIITFDIPEKYKKARKAFQQKLKEMGCYPAQKSVWIHPFPCEAELAFLKNVLEIQSFVETYLTKEMPNGKVIYNFRDLLKDCI